MKQDKIVQWQIIYIYAELKVSRFQQTTWYSSNSVPTAVQLWILAVAATSAWKSIPQFININFLMLMLIKLVTTP